MSCEMHDKLWSPLPRCRNTHSYFGQWMNPSFWWRLHPMRSFRISLRRRVFSTNYSAYCDWSISAGWTKCEIADFFFEIKVSFAFFFNQKLTTGWYVIRYIDWTVVFKETLLLVKSSPIPVISTADTGFFIKRKKKKHPHCGAVKNTVCITGNFKML